MRNNLFIVQLLNMCKMDDNIPVLNNKIVFILKSATLLKSQSVAAQTAKNAIFLVRTDFLPCVG